MSYTVGEIITDKVRLILRDMDGGGIQWKDAELITWFNEACAEVSRVRPEATSNTADVALVAGAKQSIPTGTSRLLEGICNIDIGEEGRIIRRVSRATMDSEDPNWMSGAGSTTVLRYMPSLTDPRTFYVYPPAAIGAEIRIVSSGPPQKVTQLTDAYPLPDMYTAVVTNYILFRAFSKLSEEPYFRQKSDDFYGMYKSQISDSLASMEQNNAGTRDTPAGAK